MTHFQRRWAAVALTCAALTTSACTLPGGAKSARASVPPSASASATMASSSGDASPAGATSVVAAPTTPGESGTTAATPSSSPSGSSLTTSSAEGAGSVAPTRGGKSTPHTSDTPGDVTPSEPMDATRSATPIVVGPGQTVHLGAQDATGEGWSQGGHVPTSSSYLIESLAGSASCNGPTLTLHFTLGQPTTGTASFELAQDVRSSSTTEHLAWTTDVDGVEGPSTTVAYAQHVSLGVPLKDARSVSLKLANHAPCTGTATGLVLGATITS